jgi:hypothetical protein
MLRCAALSRVLEWEPDDNFVHPVSRIQIVSFFKVVVSLSLWGLQFALHYLDSPMCIVPIRDKRKRLMGTKLRTIPTCRFPPVTSSNFLI